MFNQQSNATCKNILFNALDMHQMHESMAKLYKFARENKQITGQTELANALGETPQTVNNWEARGISQRGANVAQRKIGCDANWLLGKSETIYQTSRGNSIAHTEINDRAVISLPPAKPDKWTTRATEIMSQLNEAQRAACVIYLETYLAAVAPPKDGQTLSVAG